MDGDPHPIIRQIDHILLKTDAVRPLFDLLSGTLQLPVAWPVFPYRGFLSGAVSIDGINLEILQPLDPGLPPSIRDPGERLVVIAFEPPAIEPVVRQLAARGIAHQQPVPFRLGSPPAGVSWTTVDLGGWHECPIMLLVKYDRDQDARRAELARELRERRGGPLGILSIDEIRIGVRDQAAAERRWQRLLDPLAPRSSGRWQPAAGPALRLVHADADGLGAVLLRVHSRSEAARALGRLDEDGLNVSAIDAGDGRHGPLRLIEENLRP